MINDDIIPLDQYQKRQADGPIPLFPEMPAPSEFPLGALGPLAPAARALASKVQVPAGIAGQSILAAASLAVQAHVDVLLPFGQSRPASCYFVTIAGSGDRKTSADHEALWAVTKHEKNLRDAYAEEIKEHRISLAAWNAEKKKIEADKGIDYEERKIQLADLGPEPEPPLEPFVVTGDMTPDGLAKNWHRAHAALGVFTAEGGVFTGSHGMNAENRLRTAAMLSEAWDGRPVKRVRAGDGISILSGRRLALHVMIQPDAASGFLSDTVLRDQGLLSRMLVCAPASLAGTRFYRDPSPKDETALKAFGARLLTILEMAPPLADGTRNELEPAALPLSDDAALLWRQFFDSIEKRLGEEEDFRRIQDFASKAAEHAARIAAVLAFYADQKVGEVGLSYMESAVSLMTFYVSEALRLHTSGKTDPKLILAQTLLDWMRSQGDGQISFRDILQYGPGPLRTKEALEATLGILSEHKWVEEVSKRPRILRTTPATVATVATVHTVRPFDMRKPSQVSQNVATSAEARNDDLTHCDIEEHSRNVATVATVAAPFVENHEAPDTACPVNEPALSADDRLLAELHQIDPGIRALVDGWDREKAQAMIDWWREQLIPRGADQTAWGLWEVYAADIDEARCRRRMEAGRDIAHGSPSSTAPNPGNAGIDLSKQVAAVRTLAWRRRLKLADQSGTTEVPKYLIEPKDGGRVMFASNDIAEVANYLRGIKAERRGGQHVER